MAITAHLDEIKTALTSAGLNVVDGTLDEYINTNNSQYRIVAVSETNAMYGDGGDSRSAYEVTYGFTLEVYCDGADALTQARRDLETTLEVVMDIGYFLKSWERTKEESLTTARYVITVEVEDYV